MAQAETQDTQGNPAQAGARLDGLINPECQGQIRREIAEVGGAEVYFIARLDARLCWNAVVPRHLEKVRVQGRAAS